ncbi:membrane protein insertion efficiency factor YidD [Mycobacterium riyadhense]|uniref:membrane protein insertion efficiency factor YidD n=1 Tax=Mycobacterium riyadhense TaxID=486698 RepID=UPI00195C97AE|nr:membrane protein insertion efficiency factor YidD [Mycobacterium riyadhense]
MGRSSGTRGSEVRPVGRAAGRRLARGLIFLIQLYRHMISPLRPASCRFIPTCSQYAVDALTEYGVLRGSWLAATRLGKCGPWHPGGWDPIPERRECRADCRVDFDDASWGDPAMRGESESLV